MESKQSKHSKSTRQSSSFGRSFIRVCYTRTEVVLVPRVKVRYFAQKGGAFGGEQEVLLFDGPLFDGTARRMRIRTEKPGSDRTGIDGG